MKNETVTLSRELIERIISRTRWHGDPLKEELRAALADPVPPAGGEPEVLAVLDRNAEGGVIFTPDALSYAMHGTELVDREHVTRLQAERDGLNDELEAAILESKDWHHKHQTALSENARLQAEVERLTALKADPVAIVDESDDGLFIDIIYGEDGSPLCRGDKLYASPTDRGYVSRLAYESLKSEVERLTATNRQNKLVIDGLSIENTELQSELTKARELLGRITGPSLQDQGKAIGEAVTFLAQQSAPAAKDEVYPNAEIAAEAALGVYDIDFPSPDDEHELPAEQPAPVAAVLPERKEPKHYWDRFGKMTAIARLSAEAWNACLDEVARLNPIKP